VPVGSYLAGTPAENALMAHAAAVSKGAPAAGCEKRHLFLSFPYVCPEPVLGKSCIAYTNGSKMPFFAGTLRQSYVGAMLRLCGTGRRSSRAGSHRAQVSETTNGLRACLSTAFHLCLSRACLGKSYHFIVPSTVLRYSTRGKLKTKAPFPFLFLQGTSTMRS
jgi:hypothetical protein